LNEILLDEEVFNEINWPKSKVKGKPDGLRPLNNPPVQYNHENINSIIWVTCWIATYYYHNEDEKRVHIIELITNLPKIKIGEKLKSLIMKYIIETVSIGPVEVAYPYFNYLQHHSRNFISQSSYLKLLSKFIIFSKKICNEKEIHFKNKCKFMQ